MRGSFMRNSLLHSSYNKINASTNVSRDRRNDPESVFESDIDLVNRVFKCKIRFVTDSWFCSMMLWNQLYTSYKENRNDSRISINSNIIITFILFTTRIEINFNLLKTLFHLHIPQIFRPVTVFQKNVNSKSWCKSKPTTTVNCFGVGTKSLKPSVNTKKADNSRIHVIKLFSAQISWFYFHFFSPYFRFFFSSNSVNISEL